MELVHEWLPAGDFINVDTPLRITSTYKKELITALPLIGNSFHKEEI